MAFYQSDPVHMDEHGQWFFYKETLDARYGPYADQNTARGKLGEYINYLNSQATPAPVSTELEKVVSEYVRLRDTKAEINDRFKKELAENEELLSRADAFLVDYLNKQGATSFSVGGTTVYTESVMQAQIGDKAALMDYIRSSQQPELLQSRVSSTVLKEWMDANAGNLPPGVKVNYERVVRVRRK